MKWTTVRGGDRDDYEKVPPITLNTKHWMQPFESSSPYYSESSIGCSLETALGVFVMNARQK